MRRFRGATRSGAEGIRNGSPGDPIRILWSSLGVVADPLSDFSDRLSNETDRLNR